VIFKQEKQKDLISACEINRRFSLLFHRVNIEQGLTSRISRIRSKERNEKFDLKKSLFVNKSKIVNRYSLPAAGRLVLKSIKGDKKARR